VGGVEESGRGCVGGRGRGVLAIDDEVAGGGHFEATEEVEELATCGCFNEVCVVLTDDICCPADMLTKGTDQ